jgi:hypothetical protein
MFSGIVAERTSALYRALIVDQTGALVPASSLTTLTLTLTEKLSKLVVNGRNAQNVLGASGVAVNDVTTYDALQTDADGVTYNLKWLIAIADTTLVNNRVGQERHIAVFIGTFGAGGFTHTLELEVQAAG